MSFLVRDVVAGDIGALREIYAHHVLHGLGTFEEVPPTVEEFREKWLGAAQYGLSWLVAEDGGHAIGYAYASLFRPRTGYRYTVEDSVYIRDDYRGRGVGSALLRPLLERCERLGVRQVVAVIGDSANHGSIGLHRKMGFEPAGTVKGAGFKFGRWVDIVMMQKALNGGAESLPEGSGWSGLHKKNGPRG